MRALVPCPGCRRLLRSRESTCPFCFARRAVTLAAILPLSVACQKAVPTTSDAQATTSTASVTATAPASSSASAIDTVAPLPALSASATPSAIASARQAAIGRDAGGDQSAGILAMLSSDAGAGLLGSLVQGDAGGGIGLSTGIGGYGGPPGPSLGGIGSLVAGNVSVSMGGAHTAADDRVVRSRTGLYKACYGRGLATNPTIAGTVKVHVTVGSDGAAAATIASATGNLPSDVQQCMASTVSRTQYEAPAHTFDVELTASTTK